MSASIRSVWISFNTKRVSSSDPHAPSATDRQEQIPGFDQAKFSALGVLLVGAGGLGGEVAEGLVRKGIGCLKVYDPDRVELSNLNRQRFFAKDLGKPKAWALVRNLVPEAISETYLKACRLSFQDAVAQGLDTVGNVAVCAVDNNRTRIFASRHFAEQRTPLLIMGVSNEGDHGYVFVQAPGQACFGCAFPGAVESVRDPCPNLPAIKDILKVVGGIALYAVDSLFMSRPRRWNYKHVYLDGTQPDRYLRVERRPSCAICGTGAA